MGCAKKLGESYRGAAGGPNSGLADVCGGFPISAGAAAGIVWERLIERV